MASPLQGFTLPSLAGAANSPLDWSTAIGQIEKQVVQFYATVAARDAAITSPVENMLACTRDFDRLWMYAGAAWQFVGYYSTAGRPGVIITDAAQSITTATVTDITWGTEVSDVDGWTSGGSATLTVPTGWDGFYAISYFGTWSGAPGANSGAALVVSGSFAATAPPPPIVLAYGETMTITRALVASDTIKVQAYQASGGSLNIVSRLEIVWLGR